MASWVHPQTANALTLLRVGLVPAFVVEYLVRAPGLRGALVLFVLAAATDWLDGWVARRFGQESAFGAFLDPVADKLMVVAALMLVCWSHPTVLMVVAAMLVILREVYVSALREWMASAGMRNVVAVAAIGKWKTATQMLALVVLMWALHQVPPPIVPAAAPNAAAAGATADSMLVEGAVTVGPATVASGPMLVLGEALLMVAALLSVLSCLQYTLGAWRAAGRADGPGSANSRDRDPGASSGDGAT